MFTKISIENYRTFSSFAVDGLAKVNLIVGLNNSGKSSLLEAIYLLASQDNPNALHTLLSQRGEIIPLFPNGRPERRAAFQVSHLFYGHQLSFDKEIKISGVNRVKKRVRIYLEGSQLSLFEADEDAYGPSSAKLTVEYGEAQRYRFSLLGEGILQERYPGIIPGSSFSENPVHLVTTDYLDYEQIASLWDQITLTDKEANVVRALQILEPSVQRISFTSQRTTNSGILVKLQNDSSPIPLGSLGDGMRRVLAISASLVNAENGILLVDEIDTGLHYSVLEDVWQVIFTLAEELNLQVFATTHSGDCVRAFASVLNRFGGAPVFDDLGRLLRMEEKNGKRSVIDYQAEDLSIAVTENIEVR